MTLCIAAIAQPLQRHVVAVADLMISTSDEADSTEKGTLKLHPLSDQFNWLVMFAGDPSVWSDILRRASADIADGDETAARVQTAFEDAFRCELHRKIETEILSPYKVDLPEFLKQGPASFGEHKFTDILNKIEGTSLETQVMVAGFDASSCTPHLFSLAERSVCRHHEHLSFHAIGTGSFLALGSLYGTGIATLDLPELVYRVCEAKFLGERALGVGENTLVVMLKQGQQPHAMFTPHLDPVKGAWKSRNAAPPPKEATEAIRDYLKHINPLATNEDLLA